MLVETPVEVECPYCGESFLTYVDVSAGDQRYIEDCAVCCQPVTISVTLARDGSVEQVQTLREDDVG